MQAIILIFLGGGIGSLMRYAVQLGTDSFISQKFPVSTLLVNAVGSLIIGMLWGSGNSSYINENLKAFIFIGLLGGFTTFSTFSLDTLRLIENKEVTSALVYIVLNNVLSIGLCYAGYMLYKS
jgi:CrcB protein